MVAFSEILKFDPGQIQEIFGACSGQQQTCSTIDGHLKHLSDLHTWQGDASQAAKDAAGKTRKDLDAHGNEVWKVAAAARDCYNEAVELKTSAQHVQADADAKGCIIDPTTGTVTPPAMQGWADADKAAFYVEVNALQARVNDVIAAAERFDDNLAAAINAADGSIPLTPKGEGTNVNLADRRANQVAAYRKTYGRDPVTANDWRMAAVLDPHSYLTKYAGTSPEVATARITPQPGRGVVTMNAFIPRSEVWNLPEYDKGDARGFDSTFSPENSRALITIDYDRGVVVARQNPSVTSGGSVDVGTPSVDVSEQSDGQVNLNYRFGNPYAPGPPALADFNRETVHGSVALSGGGATPTVNGTMSNYPAIEVYQYPTDGGPPVTAYQYMPSHDSPTPFADSTSGPLTNLPFDHDVGDPSVFPQRPRALFEINGDGDGRTPLEGTPLSEGPGVPSARKIR